MDDEERKDTGEEELQAQATEQPEEPGAAPAEAVAEERAEAEPGSGAGGAAEEAAEAQSEEAPAAATPEGDAQPEPEEGAGEEPQAAASDEEAAAPAAEEPPAGAGDEAGASAAEEPAAGEQRNLGPGPFDDEYKLPGGQKGRRGEEGQEGQQIQQAQGGYGGQQGQQGQEGYEAQEPQPASTGDGLAGLQPAGEGPEADPEAEEGAAPIGLMGWLRRGGAVLASTKGLLGAGLVIFCLGVLTAGLLLPEDGPKDEPRKAPAPVKKAQVAPQVAKNTRALQPFIFVGRSGDEETIFKVGLALEFADDAAERRFEADLDGARRDIYAFLTREVEKESLGTQKDELQEAVRDLLNARLGQGQVVKVFFSEFLAV